MYYLSLGLSLGYLILMGIVWTRRQRISGLQNWLLGTLAVGLLTQAVALLPETSLPFTPTLLGVLLNGLILVLFTALSIRYLKRPGAWIAAALGVLWLVALGATGNSANATVGKTGWLRLLFTGQADTASFILVAGWIVVGLVLVLTTLYSFYRATLAEIGNQVLFWLMLIPLVLMGAVLGVSGSPTLEGVGWLALLAGLAGTVYGATARRLIDVRQLLRLTTSSGVATFVTAVIVLIAMILARTVDETVEGGFVVLVASAVLIAVLYAPLRSFLTTVVNRLFGGASGDSAPKLRRYSEEVSGVLEMEQLIDVAVKALHESLQAPRGALMLATRDDNETIRIETMENTFGDLPVLRGWIPKGSPIYGTFFVQRKTLLQYDLETDPQYSTVAPELQSFFRQLKMSAYAPIVVQGQLLGVLAASAKSNGAPFYAQDLELLATIANQMGVALRNARLVTDMRKATDQMQKLNKDLVSAKELVEQLDSVKTDFITIASHELRTPLAQIRGYTDIIDALNEQRMLDPEQMSGMTSNLRKATDRLERLIGDMLDVSQLGLDAMDLRFAQTTLENVMKLALEPLTESIKQRKLTVTARGLRGLPGIEADMQRLVQAFRNVITNAIKYTPDGGRIDVNAQTQKNQNNGRDEILITVQDTGIGIDPKNHELIFEKFFRVADPSLHSTGATKFMGAGPGLGLTIARGVIEAHGGRIWVESAGYDPEKLPGTTFYIVLPFEPPTTVRRVVAIESHGTKETAAVPQPAVMASK